MNDSLPEPAERPTGALSEVLRAAVVRTGDEAVAAGYRVPETAIRTRARRRRTLRAAGASTLTLALLAGAGIAVANLDGVPDGAHTVAPHATAVDPVGTHPACGSDFIRTVFPSSWIKVYAEGSPLDLRVGVGQAPDLTVTVENEGNQTDDPLVVDAPEGPVLLALDEQRAVVGYARLETPPGPVTLETGEGESYAGFGAIYRCPGVGDPASPYLAPGRYAAYVGQKFSDQDDSFPLSMWERAGELTVTATPAPTASPSSSASTQSRAGECRSSLEVSQISSGVVRFDEPRPVLVVAGEPFDPHATLRNNGSLDVEDAAQGGPVLLVLDGEGMVTARSQPLDPVPDGALAAGESLTFGQFEPLTDCVTGEPLAPGRYEFQLARLSTNPASRHAIDLVSWWSTLAVTEEAGATRAQVELPVLPVCGEPIEGFAFDPEFPAGIVTSAGYTSWSEEGGHVADPDGRPSVGFEFTYGGPPREVTSLTRAMALARDGVVVAVEELGGWGGAQPETWNPDSTQRSNFDAGYDCAAEEDYTEYEPAGRFTIIGFKVYDYVDEFGLPNYVVATLGPAEVDFGGR